MDVHASSALLQVAVFLKEGVQDDAAQIFLRKPQRKGGWQVGSVKFEGLSQVTSLHLAFMDERDNEWFCHPMQLGENMFRCAIDSPATPPPSQRVHILAVLPCIRNLSMG